MAELKTRKNRESVTKFLNAIEDPARRKDAKAVHALMKEVTGEKAVMWGGSIVGYGSYRYRYASGREGDWFLAGFSPRKQALSLYVTEDVSAHRDLLEKLGKFKNGKACLNVKRLDDIDLDVLRRLIERTIAAKRERSG